VGTALGPHGINIMDFCKAYNAATENQRGMVIPAEISIFEDRAFTFVTKTPPTPFLLRQAAGIEKGASNPRTDTAGPATITARRLVGTANSSSCSAAPDPRGASGGMANSASPRPTGRSRRVELERRAPVLVTRSRPNARSPATTRRGLSSIPTRKVARPMRNAEATTRPAASVSPR